MRCLRFLPVLLVLLDACIDPLQLELSSAGEKIVVDGMITNEPGPYQVNLFYSSNLENSARLAVPVSGASVSIVNSLNETELLTEISPGVYESSVGGMRGTIGVSYYLKIVTSNKEYLSTTQTMEPAGNIDELYFKFSPDEIVTSTESADAFKLFIDSHGNQGDPNLFRWRWTGVYKVRAFPELYKVGNPPVIPAPWPCSGYINHFGDLVRIKDCECCICWLTSYSSTALASDSRFTNGYEFKKIEVGSVAITGRHFYERYHVEVEQLSVSEEVHNFWKLAESQQKALGSLFQPSAVKVRGNVRCVSNPGEEVLGVFSVSAITKKSLFIEPENIPYPVPPIDTMAYDCRTSYRYATTEKPLFW